MISVKHEGDVDGRECIVGQLKTGRNIVGLVIYFFTEKLSEMLAHGFGREDISAPQLKSIGGSIEVDSPATLAKELLAELGCGFVGFLLRWPVSGFCSRGWGRVCSWSIGRRWRIDTWLIDMTRVLMTRRVVKVFGAILNSLTKAIKEIEEPEMVFEVVDRTQVFGGSV